MKRNSKRTRIAAGIALAVALAPGTLAAAYAPGTAFASTDPLGAAQLAAPVEEPQTAVPEGMVTARTVGASMHASAGSHADAPTSAGHSTFTTYIQGIVDTAIQDAEARAAEAAELAAGNKRLAFDRAAIDQIGTQERTGHTICCPSFSCAYADAVLDGTIHDHSYYTCSCCTWTDWGGGNSAYRCVGTDEQLLREAYDEILAGRPTVIHVRASYGEHWIALIGFTGATDPDHLTLANFTALDPWDGAEICAADRFALYGDGCEHISTRTAKA